MFVNLTPHEIHVCDNNGNIVRTIERSGEIARCAVSSIEVGTHDGTPLMTTKFGEISGLPEPSENVLYIVSLLVRQALPERMDLVSPGEIVRKPDGTIVGCKNFSSNQMTKGTHDTVS